MYTRIVVPLDGSRTAEGALPEAERLARNFGAGLHLVRVIDLLSPEQVPVLMQIEAAGYARALEEEEREARTYLERTAADLLEGDARVTLETRQGRVVPELIAATMPGDLLVMTTHGRTGIRRLALGSVAEEVVRLATVPVLLVRAGREPQASEDRAAQTWAKVTAPVKPIEAPVIRGFEPW